MVRNRSRVSVTVDPDLLDEVDTFAAQHRADRSSVFDDALRLWSEEQRRLAMEAQFDEGDAPAAEREGWAHMRRTAGGRFGRR